MLNAPQLRFCASLSPFPLNGDFKNSQQPTSPSWITIGGPDFRLAAEASLLWLAASPSI